ncbi:unnamed protein product [Sphagnum jensenii]|uniref:Uncharacterized protein n=1 Tax=Sphagnum jensenii TaxID=128206 RepID=A0ABP1BUD9_9BRYO
MEDFANILQRDYGLKPQGKAAPMTLLGATTTGGTAATGSHRPAVSSFDERKSWRGGNGSNRSTRAPSAAAPPAAEGRQEEEDNLFFRQSNGVSKPASRSSADPSVFFRASSDKVYQGATKSGYDDVYGEPSSGSSLTSSSFGNLLGGFNGSSSKLRTWTSQGSFNEDLLGGSGPTKMRPMAWASESKESDVLPGFQMGEPIQVTESTESTVAPNSTSIDDLLSSPAEADMSAGINSSSGSTLPASEASAFPDPLDPSSAGSSGPKSLSRANSNTDVGVHGPLDGHLKPVPVATAKAQEPSSPSKTAADSGGSISSGGVHNSDGTAVQKSFSNSLFGSNHTDSPVLSPIEPRQRPSVNPLSSGLLRPSSGNFVNNVSGVPLQRHSSGAQKAVDDWTSFFTQPTALGDEFRETEGEPAERRRIRLEKHQRIEERAAKALEEKNQRDMALQMEQEERHRLAGNLDAEIRRWSMGKEGNLRALLSSLHLILWPECNWKPVSLTDLITAPLVKKAYKSAILCVHPDKVQQKGATVQQKYTAEKVFDLLKDSFAKFNANELC